MGTSWMKSPRLSNWCIRDSRIHPAAGVVTGLPLEKIVEVRHVENLIFDVRVLEKLECASRGPMSVKSLRNLEIGERVVGRY